MFFKSINKLVFFYFLVVCLVINVLYAAVETFPFFKIEVPKNHSKQFNVLESCNDLVITLRVPLVFSRKGRDFAQIKNNNFEFLKGFSDENDLELKEKTSGIFKKTNLEDLPVVIAGISNQINRMVYENKKTQVLYSKAEQFYHQIILNALNVSNKDISVSIQLIAGQALKILYWIYEGVPGSELMEVTADSDLMLKNDKHGKSYLKLDTLPVAVAEKEGASGFYWRGWEGRNKIGANLNLNLAVNPDRIKETDGKEVYYVMNHGFIPTPSGLSGLTDAGVLSSFHETIFLQDFIAGSYQVTSTGKGHFQGLGLDIKYVTKGTGIQFNVKYNDEGRVVEVLAQYLREGSWALALPGYVDYIVNCGGLNFNDISVKLSEDQVKIILGQDFDFSRIEKIRKIVADDSVVKLAPYSVATIEGTVYLIKNSVPTPKILWIDGVSNYLLPREGLITLYTSLTPEKLEALVGSILKSFNDVKLSIVAPVEINTASADEKHRVIAEWNTLKPILSKPALQHYKWGGVANQIVVNTREDLKNPVAELWHNSTHRNGLSVIPASITMGGKAFYLPITLPELIQAHPEILGSHSAKPFFVKFLSTHFAPKVYMGFNDSIIGVGMRRFIEWLQENRRLEEKLKDVLKDDRELFDSFVKEYEKWVDYQADCKWKDANNFPDIENFVNIPKTEAKSLMKNIRAIRENIVSVLNEIDLKPGLVILSPVGYPHAIFGLSLQTHPLTGPEAKNEAWVVISVLGIDNKEHFILVEPQQTSDTTYSFADFYTPIVWDDKENKPVMRKKLSTQQIKEYVENGLKEVATIPDSDFIQKPVLISEPGAVKAIHEVLIRGGRKEHGDIWPEEYFVVEKYTLKGEGKALFQQASIKVTPVKDVFYELLVVKGSVVVKAPDQEDITLEIGSSLLIPAVSDKVYSISATEEAEVLKIYKNNPDFSNYTRAGYTDAGMSL